jgi:hypothetical protein
MKKLFSVSCIFIYLFIYLYLLPHLFTDVDHDVHLKQVSTGIDLQLYYDKCQTSESSSPCYTLQIKFLSTDNNSM